MDVEVTARLGGVDPVARGTNSAWAWRSSVSRTHASSSFTKTAVEQGSGYGTGGVDSVLAPEVVDLAKRSDHTGCGTLLGACVGLKRLESDVCALGLHRVSA